MIVIDIETTGLDYRKNQIVSMGAVDYSNGETFYQECRIYKRDKVDPIALSVNGFSESQVRDTTKITPRELYHNFLAWCEGRSNIIAGCNIAFDLSFLRKVHGESGYGARDFPFRRNVDLYSLTYYKYGKVMGLKETCESLQIEPEPKIHNALNGAVKAYECFKKLL